MGSSDLASELAGVSISEGVSIRETLLIAQKTERIAAPRAGGAAAADLGPMEPLGAPAGAAAPVAAGDDTVKGYLRNRGLYEEWYKPLSLHGNVIRVGQLHNMTVRKLQSAARAAGKELDDAAAEDIVQRLKMS